MLRKAIIVDLLTMLSYHADRERYCYVMDALFERHSDILKIMCSDARDMLPVNPYGLIWRSRVTKGWTAKCESLYQTLDGG